MEAGNLLTDVLVLSAVFSLVLAGAYLRMQHLLLRGLLASVISFNLAPSFLEFLSAHLSVSATKTNIFIVFVILLFMFLIAFRKMNFNYSFSRTLLLRVMLSISITGVFVLVMTTAFNPNLIVYDFLHNYKAFILSDSYYALLHIMVLATFLIM